MIEKILREEYGVGLVFASATTVGWAAEAVRKEFGEEVARKELRRVNRVREKLGAIPAYLN